MFRQIFSRRTLAYGAGASVLTVGAGVWYLHSGPAYPPSTRESRRPPAPWTPPSRTEMLNRLKSSGSIKTSGIARDEEFDLLIVGGGATGAGIAVDAASRGLKVALVERDDFASGTSSKSTKLVHGGVRYLQKAVFELDYEQYKLVREALHERRIFLQTAPYLSNMLPIMLPIYKYWQIPYYFAGCKMYDILAGEENMETSYLMSKGKALETFPMLKSDGLVGAVVYYDGQHNDSRMNMALVMTAVKHGPTVANYVEVTELHKNSDGKLEGANVVDKLTGDSFPIRAKGIINATGPFSDTLLTLDNPSHTPIVQPSSGVHITLPNYYSPRTMGLLDPATSDGRVIFFLPWQGNTIAGTTDSPTTVSTDPEPSEEDIRWILEEVRNYLSPDIKVRRGDVLSAWSGLRPLVRDPKSDKKGTAGLVRNHMIYVSPSGLLTMAGGKWTTYRKMAEEAVDEAVKVFGLEEAAKGGCRTETVRLVGSDGWSRNMFIGLIQRFGIESEVAKHLSDNYGDRAWTVCSLAPPTGQTWPLHGTRISPQYPFIDAEVTYAVRHEYAQTAIDVLARRTRLAFLNVRAALDALPGVISVMSAELGWDEQRKEAELAKAVKYFGTMGLLGDKTEILNGVKEKMREPVVAGITDKLKHAVGAFSQTHSSPPTLSIPPAAYYSRSLFEPGELQALTTVFGSREQVPISELPQIFQDKTIAGFGYSGFSRKERDYVLEEAGFEGRTEVDWDEFLEICASLKDLTIAPSGDEKRERRMIPVEKSGGGV